eukprot:gene50162-34432_t
MEAIVAAGGGHWLAGESLSLADLTLFPTFCMLTYYLPRVFAWPDAFHGRPLLRRWWTARCGIAASTRPS